MLDHGQDTAARQRLVEGLPVEQTAVEALRSGAVGGGELGPAEGAGRMVRRTHGASGLAVTGLGGA